MKTVFITNCSATRTKEPVAVMSNLATEITMAGALSAWWEMVDPKKVDAKDMYSPGEIYRGGGFAETMSLCANENIEDIYIVTGGQGLIKVTDKIVPYDFSASKKENDNIHKYVTREPFVLHTWWSGINMLRHEVTNPVAKLAEDATIDVIVIACTKVFLKYIERDLLSIPVEHQHKVKVFITASSIGSVAKQLKPMLYPYNRAMINHLPGNRNNSTQRAAIAYFNKADQGVKNIQEWFITNAQDSPDDNVDHEEQILEFFKGHKNVLELTPDEAYHITKQHLKKVGGIVAFKGLFRTTIKSVIKAEGKWDSAEACLMALDIKMAGNIMTDEDEENTLDLLSILGQTLAKAEEEIQMNSAQICTWAKAYCNATDTKLPIYLTSSAKLARLVASNAEVVGLQEITSATVSGKRYRALPK